MTCKILLRCVGPRCGAGTRFFDLGARIIHVSPERVQEINASSRSWAVAASPSTRVGAKAYERTLSLGPCASQPVAHQTRDVDNSTGPICSRSLVGLRNSPLPPSLRPTPGGDNLALTSMALRYNNMASGVCQPREPHTKCHCRPPSSPRTTIRRCDPADPSSPDKRGRHQHITWACISAQPRPKGCAAPKPTPPPLLTLRLFSIVEGSPSQTQLAICANTMQAHKYFAHLLPSLHSSC